MENMAQPCLLACHDRLPLGPARKALAGWATQLGRVTVVLCGNRMLQPHQHVHQASRGRCCQAHGALHAIVLASNAAQQGRLWGWGDGWKTQSMWRMLSFEQFEQ